ncbi:unnamed protein product [Discosporangium mesarthrocarpum]
MAILEEVDPSTGESVEGLKNEFRRRRKAKGRKSKNGRGGTTGTHAHGDKPLEGGGLGHILAVFLPALVLMAWGLNSRSLAMDRKSNKCSMTYSRPNYFPVPVPVPGDVEGVREPNHGVGFDEAAGINYRLFRYMDGKLPKSERNLKPLKPQGTPVLFVPGHLGSYQQVRSLGSHAANAKVSGPWVRLDLFTLDFREELTALHSTITWKQAEFFNLAVRAILDLYSYRGEDAPTSVIVVGHSYGGLVASAAFALRSFSLGSVSDIVTLGTPHRKGPWVVDQSMFRLHQHINALWHPPPLPDTPLGGDPGALTTALIAGEESLEGVGDGSAEVEECAPLSDGEEGDGQGEGHESSVEGGAEACSNCTGPTGVAPRCEGGVWGRWRVVKMAVKGCAQYSEE